MISVKRIISLILVLFFALSLTSCANPVSDNLDADNPLDDSIASSSSHTAEDEFPSPAESSISYPLVTDGTTVQFWWVWSSDVLQRITDETDILLFAEMEKITGLNIDMTLVSYDNAATDFTLLLTGGDYPDYWEGFSSYYNAGIDSAIDDGIVLPLDDYLQYMPNLTAFFESNPVIRKNCYTDNGHLGGIPALRINADGTTDEDPWLGNVIRQDWLDALNMEIPTTYREMEQVLAAMQTSYTANPLYLNSDLFGLTYLHAGYGISSDFIQIDGTVKYSPLEQGYRDYITMMADWYQKGYIDPDFTSNIFPWMDLGVAGDESYGVFAIISTNYDVYVNMIGNPEARLSAVAPLKLQKEDRIHIGTAGTGGGVSGCINAESPHAELICKWWDYLFSEDGILLSNWGIENETFAYNTDGSKTWIGPLVSDAADFNLTLEQSLRFVYNCSGYYEVDREYCLANPDSRAIQKQWIPDDTNYVYPSSVSLTQEEAEDYAYIMSDIETYVQESIMKFVVGEKSLDEWDSFLAGLEQMNIQSAIDIKQGALDRYNAR